MIAATDLSDLEAKAARGEAFGRADAERMLASADLVSVGLVGQAARTRHLADRVTYARVTVVAGGEPPVTRGEAGEVRLTGTPASADEAGAWVRRAAAFAAGAPLTGFRAHDLLALADGDLARTAALARVLRAAGLEAVAETPVDASASADALASLVEVLVEGGLHVRRLTVDRVTPGAIVDLVERALAVQRRTRGVRAFAPLARHEPPETPSTGYDDVRAVAVAAAMGGGLGAIQVDWPLYGPKLAQVAIAYGASDLDGVSAVDTLQLGHRRSPVEDIERQIRAAGGAPRERNGRYETAS